MRFLSVIFVTLLSFTVSAWACPFCSPTNSDLFTITKNSNAVCKVQRVGQGKFKILQVIKGKAKVGKIVIAGEPDRSAGGEQRILLLATIANPSQPYWSEPVRALTPQEYKFITALLQTADENKQRDLAAANLLSKSTIIEDAAYGILALAPLEAVQKRLSLSSRKGLMAAINDPKKLKERKSLYLLMLLPSVTPKDKDWVRGLMFRPRPDPLAAYFPALMAAYARAAGSSGVKEMAQVLLNERTSVSESFNPTSGFTFIGTESEDPRVRDAARAVIRGELAYPERAVFVIPPLAKWKDYSAAPQVEKLAYSNADTPWVVGSVVRYFRSFDSAATKKALQRLTKEFPDIVEANVRPY